VTTFKRTTGFLALAACLLAAGCGSDDEGAGIPQDSAAALERQLDSIQDRFEFPGGAACADITDGDDPNTAAVQRTLDGLPNDVDQDVRDALVQGFDRLFQLVQEQCEEPQTDTETETTPPPEPVPTDTTDTTETEPPPTETEPPPTETEEPPPTSTEPAPAPGEGGDAPGGEGGSGGSGQGGDATGGQGGSGGGALVPGDQG
jgi:hypothetical protein